MNLKYLVKNLITSKFKQIVTVIFFVSFFAIGITIYKDFGLSIDEPFQRSVGYYWHIYLLETFSSNTDLIAQLRDKFNKMYWSDYLNQNNLIQYGIFFDTIASFLEEIFDIEYSQKAFLFKHFLTFFCFFLSSIFFYKIALNRFKNIFFSICITFFYLSSPRIFAEAFYNSKDIVFMSFCVCSLYFAFKNFDDLNYKNLFLFTLFCSFATNVRVVGVLLFLLFVIFLLFNCLEEKKFFKKNILKFIFFLTSYPILIYIFWPFLWESPIDNLFFTIKSFVNFNWSGEGLLYLGNFHDASNLPWHYIPIWILATTPIVLTIFFIIGFFNISSILSQKILNLSEKNKLWDTSIEKKDFFIYLFFLSPIFLVIFFNSTLYGGWRHLYFIYPGFVYLAAVGVSFLLQEKSFVRYKRILYLLIISLFLNNTYNLIKFHPYQNVYFNYFFAKNANKLFEIDYWGLGNLAALKFLAKEEYFGSKMSIKVSSYTPLDYSKLLLNDKDKNKFSKINTTNQNQEFLFTNYIYEKNPKFEKKYFISSNYDKIYTLKRGNIIINEIYKKKLN